MSKQVIKPKRKTAKNSLKNSLWFRLRRDLLSLRKGEKQLRQAALRQAAKNDHWTKRRWPGYIFWLMGRIMIRQWWTGSTAGHLSWKSLCWLSWRNLRYARTRTLITSGAIAVGSAAMVFLVSFGYGLQDIVTKRLVHPYAMRSTDVQSNSTALTLNQAAVVSIQQLSDVEDVIPIISLAGSAQMDRAKMDVVIIGADNRLFDYGGLVVTAGKPLSKSAITVSQVTPSESNLLVLATMAGQGRVAGTEGEAEDHAQGDLIAKDPITFRIRDERYIPLRARPVITAPIIGYVRGSVIKTYTGYSYWGSAYADEGTSGRAFRTISGDWLGTWIKAELPLWRETAATVYEPAMDEQGKPVQVTGYVPTSETIVLNAVEQEAERLSTQVLGVATASAENEEQALLSLMTVQPVASGATALAASKIEVGKDGAKEVLVSTGLLSSLKKNATEVIGSTMNLEYIVSGGSIPGMAGRVLSQPAQYKIIGVVKDDSKPIVYAPIADVTSLGVTRYSAVKVVTIAEKSLAIVRNKVEAMGFVTQSIVDTIAQVEKLFRLMRVLLGLVGTIALVVALLGMFNTLTISLLERTREVGVMKTLGTTNHDVIRLYLIEAALMGLLGGIVGVCLGTVLGMGVDGLLVLFRGDGAMGLFRAPIGFLAIMVTVSVMVGVMTGFYPAKRATKISALNALRYE